MPTYLYECENCGRFEEFQKITDDPLDECPKCSGKVKRVIGAPGIIFKGSGFYSTDNRDSKSTINSKDEKTKEKEKDNKKNKNNEKSTETVKKQAASGKEEKVS